MRTLRAVRFDLLFLFRYGFIQAYAFVALIYCAAIIAIPSENIRIILSVSLAYSDISMLGCIFTGAALHLEKQSGTIKAVGILPVSFAVFLVRRTFTLSGVSTLFALMPAMAGGRLSIEYPVFAAGAFFCALTFTLIGTSIMTRTGNLSRFIFVAGIFTLPAGVPLLRYLGFTDNPILLVLPGAGGLMLMDRAAGNLSPGGSVSLAVILLNLLVWAGIALRFAASDFRKRLVEGAGV